MDPDQQGEGDKVEKLSEECLIAYTSGDIEAVQAILETHPEHADELRERLQSLAKLGLLEGAEQVPQNFGPYEIRGRIGRGGMSEVFLAFDARMKREVALKCAHAGLALEERAQRRFQREVEAVAKLNHPGIVPVFDAGESGGRAYFTMEYVKGATLSDLVKALIENERLPQDEQTPRSQVIAKETRLDGNFQGRPYIEIVCRWILELAEALAHAHAAGVIHRDVNPANIIIRRGGHAQLFDFGLAMLQDAPSLTMFGEFTGTPYYVSPEQLSGKAGPNGVLDERCDIYSLGVTLFELLTLQRPFQGSSTAEVLARIQNGSARTPRAINPKIPRDLELICLTALDHDRARRYPSMLALAADLRALLAFEPVSARPLGRTERTWRFVKRRPTAAIALILSAILFLGMPPVLISKNATIGRERDAALESSRRATESARQATLSADLANQEVERANQAVTLATESAHRADRTAAEFENFLVGLFGHKSLGATNVTVDQLVANGIERLSQVGLREDEEIELSFLEATGRVFSQMGHHVQAQKQLDQVYARRLKDPNSTPEEIARAAFNCAAALSNNKAPTQSHEVLARALNDLPPTDENKSLRTDLHLALAACDQDLAQPTGADKHLSAALASMPPQPSQRQRLLSAKLSDFTGHYQRSRDLFLAARSNLGNHWAVDPAEELGILSGLTHSATHLAPQEGDERIARRLQGLQARADLWTTNATNEPNPLPLDVLPGWRKEVSEGRKLAAATFQKGQVDEALDALDQLHSRHPNDSLIASSIATFNIQSGRMEAAIAALQQVIRLEYNRSRAVINPITHRNNFDGGSTDPRFVRLLEQLEEIAHAELALHVSSVPDPKAVLIFIPPTDAGPKDPQITSLQRIAKQQGWTFITLHPVSPRGPGNLDWIKSQGNYDYEAQLATDAFTNRLQPLLADRSGELSVILASSGDSGPFAAHFAIRNPGLVHALVLLDTFPGPEQRTINVQDAAISGLHIAVVDDPTIEIEWVAEGTTQAEFGSTVAAWFETLAFDTRLFQNESGEDLESIFAATFERVQALR